MPDTTEELNKQINNKQPIFEIPGVDCELSEEFDDRLGKAIQYILRDVVNIHEDQNKAYNELQTATNQLSYVQQQLDVAIERVNGLQDALTKKDNQLKILLSKEIETSVKNKLVDAIILVHENDV